MFENHGPLVDSLLWFLAYVDDIRFLKNNPQVRAVKQNLTGGSWYLVYFALPEIITRN